MCVLQEPMLTLSQGHRMVAFCLHRNRWPSQLPKQGAPSISVATRHLLG